MFVSRIYEVCARRVSSSLAESSRIQEKCEVCGRSYSFVPVYSENAPERLPCNEFLTGLFSRVSRYMKLIALWIVVILLNTFCCSLHPWGQEVAAACQRGFWMSRKFASLLAGLLYSTLIVCLMFIITAIRKQAGDPNIGRILGDAHPADFIWNGLQQGVLGGVMQVLWKYTKILCDWFLLKLIKFLTQRRGLIVVLRNAPLHEFGVLRRLLFFLDDDAFAVLTINLYVSILFVLLPLSIGSIVLATVGGSYFSGNSPVIFGYKMMLSIPIAYSEILFTLHHNSFQALVRWFLLGFHFIAIELPCLLWGFSVKASKNLSLIKDAFVFWKFLQEIIHKRAFWYLLDVTDPDYKITNLYLSYTFFAFASHGALLVTSVHLPIKAIALISPSFFPLELWVTDERLMFGAYAIYFNIMTLVPRGEGFQHADQNVRPLLQPRQPYDGNLWFVLCSIAEGSRVIHGSQNAEDDIKDQRDNRIALMLVLAAFSLFLFGTAFMALPILVGRVFFDSISIIMLRFEITHHDEGKNQFASQICLDMDTQWIDVLHLDLCHTRITRSTYRPYDHHPVSISIATKRITRLFHDPRLVDRCSGASHLDLSGKRNKHQGGFQQRLS
ncbi:unnamed protein product [Arabis nemorensis]|uniref:Uncharacterized protein n=1 Tax=Arabis nemorensis TaxID=586526 RepID=A0A565B5W2_9BRAS|nr:unnamed protein product [Arabis nemorensis]